MVTDEAIDLLMQDGYQAGWMFDIQEGDLLAIVPLASEDPMETLVVQRIGGHNQGSLISFIGTDLDDRQKIRNYGRMHPVYIKRQES